MPQHPEVGRSATAFDADATLTVVVEMSRSTWLVAGLVPGVDRRPLKRLEPDEAGLLAQLGRWRQEAAVAGRTVRRIVLAYEAGRDGFWLARWLRARGVEAHTLSTLRALRCRATPGAPKPTGST